MRVLENNDIKEKVYVHKYGNGLEILLIPKKGFSGKSIMFGTKFGSINNKFVVNGEKVTVPDGIAHFLEHKVFEQKNGQDALFTLSSLGANVNAYTTLDHTVYFFDTIDKFEESTRVLFDFVQNPYFTDENVEKEKGIINQELQMYDDDEGFQVYINLLKNLYHVHPVRIDTGGTIETVAQIDKDVLYKCYNTFYNISNMVVCVCGDFEIDEMIKFVGSLVPEKSEKMNVKQLFPVEPKEIFNKKTVVNMSINTPLLALGFKDINVGDRTIEEKIKFDVATQIAMDMLLGKSSELYKKIYSNNLLSGSIGLEYAFQKDYGYAIIDMSTVDPEKVIIMIQDEIKNMKYDANIFERVRKTLQGEYILQFNNISEIARTFFADYMRGVNTLDYMKAYKTVTIDDVKRVFEELITEERMAISIVDKKGE